MDSIPAGAYVVVRNIPSYIQSANKYASDWERDTLVWGSNNSIYHRLVAAGLVDLDKFSVPRAFSFVYKKSDPSFIPQSKWTDGIYDRIIYLSIVLLQHDRSVSSPLFDLPAMESGSLEGKQH